MIRKFLSLSADEKLLLIEAVGMLYLSKIIVCFPFRYYIKLLKPSRTKVQEANGLVLNKIRLSLKRANRLTFWKNVCLVKSVAGRLMLQRRKISSVLTLGLMMQNGTKLSAHAWLKSGDIYVTPKGDTDYKEIFSI